MRKNPPAKMRREINARRKASTVIAAKRSCT
jgi:hypothetical protein